MFDHSHKFERASISIKIGVPLALSALPQHAKIYSQFKTLKIFIFKRFHAVKSKVT